MLDLEVCHHHSLSGFLCRPLRAACTPPARPAPDYRSQPPGSNGPARFFCRFFCWGSRRRWTRAGGADRSAGRELSLPRLPSLSFESLEQLLDTADPRSATARPQTRSARARQLPDSLWTALFCILLDVNQAPTAAEPTPAADAEKDARLAAIEQAKAGAAAAAKAKAEEEAAAAAKFKAEEDARAFCDSNVHLVALLWQPAVALHF